AAGRAAIAPALPPVAAAVRDDPHPGRATVGRPLTRPPAGPRNLPGPLPGNAPGRRRGRPRHKRARRRPARWPGFDAARGRSGAPSRPGTGRGARGPSTGFAEPRRTSRVCHANEGLTGGEPTEEGMLDTAPAAGRGCRVPEPLRPLREKTEAGDE